jgi:DNA-binding transcriptional regulator PaaX
MALNQVNKYCYKATKQLIIDLMKAGGSESILLGRPSGSMFTLKPFMDDENNFDREKFRRTLRHAKDYGYIGVKEKNGEITLTLSEAGHEKALKYSLKDMHIETPPFWDKKWRLVLFDIPQDKKLARNVFKNKLNDMGFALIQKGAYVHPYPCHNEIEFIRSLYEIKPYVKLLVVDKIEDEEDLRKRFGL